MLPLLIPGQFDRVIGIEVVDHRELTAIRVDDRHVLANHGGIGGLAIRVPPGVPGPNCPSMVVVAEGVPAGAIGY